MGKDVLPVLKRRRMPQQGRSQITVDAIFEATIQVLLHHGPVRINTTRIAERAGVSVGTLYQYFPNKQSLLLALLERHLGILTQAIDHACLNSRNGTSDHIATGIVASYLGAVMKYAEVSPALYFIAADLNAGKLLETAMQRSVESIENVLGTASNGPLAELNMTSRTLAAVLYGTVPAFCMKVMPAAAAQDAEKQLGLMFRSYLAAHATETIKAAEKSPD